MISRNLTMISPGISPQPQPQPQPSPARRLIRRFQALQREHGGHRRLATGGLDPQGIAQVGQELSGAPPGRGWRMWRSLSQFHGRNIWEIYTQPGYD